MGKYACTLNAGTTNGKEEPKNNAASQKALAPPHICPTKTETPEFRREILAAITPIMHSVITPAPKIKFPLVCPSMSGNLNPTATI